MDHNYALPFPRGGTFADGNTNVLATGDPAKLAGRVYEVPDEQHGTGRNVKLRVVQLSSAVTAARKALAISTTTLEHGRISGGYVAADGAIGKPLDDAYAVGATLPQYDYVYVVEAGPCDVNSSANWTGSDGSTAAGSLVQWENGGCICRTAATTGDHVGGTLVETQAAASTAYLVDVEEGLANIY